MGEYRTFYLDDSCRLEAMLMCSLTKRINWCEDGMKVASWRYNMADCGEAEGLSQVFRDKAALRIDRRRKRQVRSMSLGDIIVFDDVPWIVTAFGFVRVPSALWDYVEIICPGDSAGRRENQQQ